jgi:ribosomal protein S18 acetylase RimI-like enzyme
MDAKTSHERPIFPIRVNIGPEQWVSIRPIERADASALSDFYAQLSDESRRRRFLGGALPRPQQIATLAGDPGIVAVLLDPGPRDGAIVAHASVQPDGHHGAEIAFAVADGFQGHGLGRRLVNRAVRLARELGADRASATILVGNALMRHLLTRAGQPLRGDSLEAGTEELVLDLNFPA